MLHRIRSPYGADAAESTKSGKGTFGVGFGNSETGPRVHLSTPPLGYEGMNGWKKFIRYCPSLG